MSLPQEIIRSKRDGRALSEAEIAEFIAGLTSGDVTEGQAAAFAMAVFFRGMTLGEQVALTRAMTGSGATINWRRRRQRVAYARPNARGVRRLRADDLRARPRPYRRHARQARFDSGLRL